MNLKNLALLIVLILSCFMSISQAQSKKLKTTKLSAKCIAKIVYNDSLVSGFFSKHLNCEGILIRSAAVVDNRALFIAAGKIKTMLTNMPIAKKNLVTGNVELHIIGKDQQTSDLPEYRDQKGVTYMDNGIETDIDRRTRGMGGATYASCGEENLLRLPQDRYAGGSDICVHEFAHTIMSTGLDNTIRTKIEAQRKQSVSNGLWKGAYASTNAQEYWAELSMWYFGYHGEYLKGNIPAVGPKGLKEYDLKGFKLLDSVYSGLIQPKLLPKTSILVMAGVPSVASKQKAILTIVNSQPKYIKVFWINYDGKPVFNRTVAAGVTTKISTYTSNVWMIEPKDEKVYLQVNEATCRLECK